MSRPSASVTNRAGMHKTLALLCCFTSLATSLFQANPARTDWCLLAVIATPLAEPQIKMPKSADALATSSETACA